MPDVTKLLLDMFYLADAKKADRGEIFPVY
jgi:hypothetical protein